MTPLICFEIVGLPGSGKTTIARELQNRNDRFRLEMPPDWKKLRTFPFYLKNFMALAPVWTSLILSRRGRKLNIYEFLWIIFLNGWYRQLTRLKPNGGVVILDQGPIFWMSQMILSREEQIRDSFFGEWCQKTLEKWGRVLDRVVWLDSSDSILIRRINARQQDHIIKGASTSRASHFLARHRKGLDQAITMLREDRRSPEVILFDTGQLSVDEIVNNLSREFKLNENLESVSGFQFMNISQYQENDK